MPHVHQDVQRAPLKVREGARRTKNCARTEIVAFESVRDIFITNLPPRVFLSHEKPTSKYVCDRHMRLEEKRRDSVRESEGMPGNKVMVNDLDVLLDDLIFKNDEFQTAHHAERDEQNVQ